jgi:dinuclear metal center YbgI/SA1388 family protein
MRIREVIDFMAGWAPPEAALAKDNPGLQVGDPHAEVKNILVCLEVTDRIIEEAVENEVNLILSHHPLIFQPLRSIDSATWLGRKIARLLQAGIAVYSAHTNLDAARDGVSITLAKRLGIEHPKFLAPADGRWLKKIAVFVPADHLDAVRGAMAAAGAGVIGEYSQCSFSSEGTGTFFGGPETSPAVGEKGNLERVREVRLEMILPAWRSRDVITAMRKSHPYEEVAYDLYPLENEDGNYGFGAIGSLLQPISLKEFLSLLQKRLGVKAVGVVEGPSEKILRVAVCGGSGGELAEAAFRQGADAFVTGEMKYHSLLEYEDRMTLIIAGHYPTEAVILPIWVDRLQRWLGETPISVIETKLITNPVKYLT